MEEILREELLEDSLRDYKKDLDMDSKVYHQDGKFIYFYIIKNHAKNQGSTENISLKLMRFDLTMNDPQNNPFRLK